MSSDFLMIPIGRTGRRSDPDAKASLFNFNFAASRSNPKNLPSKKSVNTENTASKTRNPHDIKAAVPNNASITASVITAATNQQSSSSSSKQNDNSIIDDEVNTDTVEFVISENRVGYEKLVNSHFDNNKMVAPRSLLHNVASFMLPSFEKSNSIQDFPGVFRTMSNSVCGDVKVGYLKIQKETVMPTTLTEPTCSIIYWVIKGIITFKSAGGNYEKSGQKFLFGKKFSPGACIVVGPSTLYTLENWNRQDVLLSYCLVTGENLTSSSTSESSDSDSEPV